MIGVLHISIELSSKGVHTSSNSSYPNTRHRCKSKLEKSLKDLFKSFSSNARQVILAENSRMMFLDAIGILAKLKMFYKLPSRIDWGLKMKHTLNCSRRKWQIWTNLMLNYQVLDWNTFCLLYLNYMKFLSLHAIMNTSDSELF